MTVDDLRLAMDYDEIELPDFMTRETADSKPIYAYNAQGTLVQVSGLAWDSKLDGFIIEADAP